MNILSYLINYLNSHKTLVVNNLGTFSLKRMNGFYEADTEILYPPKFMVRFTESKEINDDFALYLSDELSIDIEKAIYYVEKYVRDIQNSLDENGIFNINPLGILKKSNDQIKLIIEENANVINKFYGLTPIPFNVKYIEEEFDETETESETIPLPAISNYSLAEQALKSIAPEPLALPNNKSNFLLYVITFITITLILVGIFYFYYPLKPYNAHLNHIENVVENKNDTITTNIAENLEDSPKANVVLGADTTFYYEIIVINKVKNNRVEKLINSLKNNGLIDAHPVFIKDTSYKKISVEKFNNLDSAENALNKIKQKYYPKAYIETIKSIN